jgi:hypothetical protein
MYDEFESMRNTQQAYAGTWGAVNACIPDGWPSTSTVSERRGTAYRPQPAIDISTAIDHNDTSDDHTPRFNSWTAAQST